MGIAHVLVEHNKTPLSRNPLEVLVLFFLIMSWREVCVHTSGSYYSHPPDPLPIRPCGDDGDVYSALNDKHRGRRSFLLLGMVFSGRDILFESTSRGSRTECWWCLGTPQYMLNHPNKIKVGFFN
jgi:hypothetical protein